jgi:hypothetical protein
MKLILRFHLVSRFEIHGASLPLPVYFFMASCLGTRTTSRLELESTRSPAGRRASARDAALWATASTPGEKQNQ